jgi:hypothetical protein
MSTIGNPQFYQCAGRFLPLILTQPIPVETRDTPSTPLALYNNKTGDLWPPGRQHQTTADNLRNFAEKIIFTPKPIETTKSFV